MARFEPIIHVYFPYMLNTSDSLTIGKHLLGE
jgi:hypothetical protein